MELCVGVASLATNKYEKRDLRVRGFLQHGELYNAPSGKNLSINYSFQINTVRSHTRVCAVIFRLPNVNGVSDFNRLLGNGWCNLNYSNGGPFWPILDKMFFFFGRIFLSVMANPWNLQVKAPPGAPLDQKLTRDHTYQPKFCRKFSTVRLNLLTKYEECKKQIEIWRAL